MELHILTFIEQCSGLQGRRRCLAAGVLDIWHGTDHQGTARKSAASLQGGTGVFLTRHGTSESPESERL